MFQVNESDARMIVYWIHPQTREAVLMCDQAGIMKGADFPLDSYVGHEFELREMPGKSGECKEQTCRHVYFTVSDGDEQLAKLTKNYEVEFVDNKVKANLQASDLVKDCKANAEKSNNPMDELVKCVEGGVAKALEAVNEEIAYQASIRKDIAATLENYTCVDDTLNSTDDVTTSVWRDHSTSYTVHVKHERAASRIHMIENFIDHEECEAMEQAAAPTLHDATVADGKGGSRLSDNRKAKQAGIQVPWDQPDHPISRLSRRVYDYTNHVLSLNIDEKGQEDLMSIQYFGRGLGDEEPDRYTPHCDGDCSGQPHKFGQRMATMVMYCTVADTGGHTNFRNSGVHVKPEKYNAIFFSYIDPETKIMDTGFTEHSGCPVFEGEKKIVTQWIRLGVSAEVPWNSFNTLGIHHSEVDSE